MIQLQLWRRIIISVQIEICHPILKPLVTSSSVTGLTPVMKIRSNEPLNFLKMSHRERLGRVLPLLQSLFPYNGTDEDAKLLTDIALDKGVQQDYCAFLGRKILKSMQQCFTTLLNDDGSINQNALHDCIIETCEVHLFQLKDLQPLFDKPGGSEAQDKTRVSIDNLLNELLPKLLKDINMKRKRLLPSMDVILNSEELAHLPEECLHTLHLHVTPSNIKLYTEE